MELEKWLKSQVSTLKEHNLLRKLPALQGLVNFCSNDYLGLSQHPLLKKAALKATEEFGTSSSSSRLVSGTLPIHIDLEKTIAEWYEKGSALLFNSGYHAGIGVIPAIAQNGLVFSDELNHACLIDGCRLSQAKVYVYKHKEMEHLEWLLKKHHNKERPSWIITESIFSMEGEKAPLHDLIKLKKKYSTCLLIDEAHAVGVYGNNGRGVAEEFDIIDKVDLIMGTFSKALGSFGGFAIGSKNMMEFLINKTRSFIFTTALPPSVAAVNKASIELVKKMKLKREKLHIQAGRVRRILCQIGFSVLGKEDSLIIPIIIGESEKTVQYSKELIKKGLWVQAIRPPTVPNGTSRLRLTISASRTQKEYDLLFKSFQALNP